MNELPKLPDNMEMVVPDDPDTWLSGDGWIHVGMTWPTSPRPSRELKRFQPPQVSGIETGAGKLYFKPC